MKLFYVCEACQYHSDKQRRKTCEIISVFKVVKKPDSSSCLRIEENSLTVKQHSYFLIKYLILFSEYIRSWEGKNGMWLH